MVKKVVMVCIVLMRVTVVAGVAGGIQISPTSNPSMASAPNNLQFQSNTGPFVGSKNSDVYHYPGCYHVNAIKPENRRTFNTLADACAAGYRPCKDCNPPACTPSSTPTPTPTPTPTQLPTQVIVAPSGGASVAQGQAITFTTTLYSINEHKNVCGAVNYYIDDYAAGGTWNINPSGACSASSGSLSLAGADTAKLSSGTHTLKIDWLGDSTYGPAQYVEQFTVTASSTPAPTSTPTGASPTPASTPTGASPSTSNVAQASAAARSQNPIPGFEALYALGVLAAVVLALRVTRRR